MRQPKIDFNADEIKVIRKLYVTDKMSMHAIWEHRYKQWISIRTFWYYIQKHCPDLVKYKSLRQ